MANLILVRGLPGSGKSTFADKLTRLGYMHLEADMYFLDDDGNYKFDPSKLRDAHSWCQWHCDAYLTIGHHVVVSNTFSRLWEMEFYLSLDANITVIECQGNYGNIHGIPDKKIQQMKERWEAYP